MCPTAKARKLHLMVLLFVLSSTQSGINFIFLLNEGFFILNLREIVP